MTNKYLTMLLLTAGLYTSAVQADVSITIDTETDNIPISPYIYGRNGAPANNSEYEMIREAGIRFERMSDGNNCTKYNWKKKLTSHPDWYGNVYDCDWDSRASKFQEKLPEIKGLFAFQLLGKVAKSKDYNFKDWDYNKSQWWTGCTKKVVGGGYFDDNKKAVLGDTSLYLQDWPADSTVAIYPHWRDDLGLDMEQFNYWNMDNEMEIWGGTHDDVMPGTYTDSIYEDIMQKYFAVAKAARAINPNIKLCGPNAASEWTWFQGCGNTQPTYNGKTYCWLEYFIMRCAEEQKKTGIRMIDVFDIHNYPQDKTEAKMLQTHRMYWDKDFRYSGANGVKTINGGWNTNINNEYIFVRCKEWIDQYFGEGNGITFAVGEYNILQEASQMVHALAYASCIGEGARNGMEYFTPWTWYNSMWEVVNLMSHQSKEINVGAISNNEAMVSAYSSKNAVNDSLTIILVNRSTTEQQTDINMIHTVFCDGAYPTTTLSSLPETKTFVSQTNNAQQHGTVQVNGNKISLTLPPYSITSIVLHDGVTDVKEVEKSNQPLFVYPNPAEDIITIEHKNIIQQIELLNMEGKVLQANTVNGRSTTMDVFQLASGIYVLQAQTSEGMQSTLVNVK